MRLGDAGSKRARLGILGGSFNPVHLGHLLAAQSALERFDLSRVLFVPCNRPPHKDSWALADFGRRYAMLELALEDDLRCEVSDVERQRGGVSYSIDTVRRLRELHPSADLHFIIGSDTLSELHQWKEIYDLLNLCTFVTLCRPGRQEYEVDAGRIALKEPWPEKLLAHCDHGRLIEVSSSDIRYRIAEGLSIRYLVPSAVEMYIAEHGLYLG